MYNKLLEFCSTLAMAAINKKAQGFLHEILNLRDIPQFRKTQLFPIGGPSMLVFVVAQLDVAMLSSPLLQWVSFKEKSKQ